MTRMVKIDIPTSHEQIGNLHFDLKIIFHCIFIKKNMHFLTASIVNNYESKAYCITIFFFRIFTSETMN